MSNTTGYWWSSCPDEAWEGFALTREEALKQIDECKYYNADGSVSTVEITLRPGFDCDDETQKIVFTGPAEIIQIDS